MSISGFGCHLPKALALAFMALPATLPAADYESPPVLEAESLLGDIPVSGAHYEILPNVPTDGFMARFTISSDFGDFAASGPGMLEERLVEIRALAALQNVQDDEQFKEAAEETAKETADSLRQFAKNPVETLKGAPEGVGRFFNRSGRTIKTGLQKIGDARQGKGPGSDPEGVSNLPGGASETTDETGESLASRIARAGGDAAVNVLGYDKQRRRIAKDLGVDPYTTNKVLSQTLDDVTWAAFAGGLGVNAVTTLIPGGFILSTSSRLSDWVWDTAPGDLRVAIEQTLLSLGVGQEDVDLFLRHPFYTLTMQVVVADSLKALEGVEGRADVFPLVLSVGSEGQARFVVQTLDMLRNYHATRQPLAGLRVEGTIIGRTGDGDLAVMAPVDYMTWSETLGNFSARFTEEETGARSLHISGRASARAKAELTALDWHVEEASDLGPSAFPLQ